MKPQLLHLMESMRRERESRRNLQGARRRRQCRPSPSSRLERECNTTLTESSGATKEPVLTCWVDVDFRRRERNDFAHTNDADGTDGNVACFENLDEAGAGNFVLSPAYASVARICRLFGVCGRKCILVKLRRSKQKSFRKAV